MSRVPRPLLICVGVAVLAALLGMGLAHAQEAPGDVVDPLPFTSHAQEVRFQKLTRQLRCLVCQDESLADSNAALAQQMRHIVFAQMQKGWSDDEIKQYLVNRYSDYVLYKPPLKPSTWLLWFGPLVIILIGAGIVIVAVRRRRASAPRAVPVADDDDW